MMVIMMMSMEMILMAMMSRLVMIVRIIMLVTMMMMMMVVMRPKMHGNMAAFFHLAGLRSGGQVKQLRIHSLRKQPIVVSFWTLKSESLTLTISCAGELWRLRIY